MADMGMVLEVRKKYLGRTFALLSLFVLASCGGRPALMETPHLRVTADTSLPPPTRDDLVATDRPSLIGPFDTLNVEVFGVQELTREVQVDASGRIALPLVGVIEATGKTAEELGHAVETALRAHFVRDPHVTVNLSGSVSQVVTVDGEVREPGLYPVTNQMTLMRAIASAKGLTEFAKTDDVVVLRTVTGQKMAGLYNVAAIRRGQYDDPVLYANDVVIVGDSPPRRLFRDVLSVAPLFVAPIVALIQR